MRYLDRIKRNIVRLGDDDWPALDAFQKEMRGMEPEFHPFDRRYYEWTQEKNPHKGEGGPQFWIYRGRDGSIQGQQVGIPFSLSVKGKPYRASWAVNLMVEPALRMRGIGNALSSVHQEDNDIALGIGISDDAYQSYRRAGWIDLGKMGVFIRPLDARAMLPLFGLSDDLLHRTAAGICNGLLRLLDLNAALVFRLFRGIEVEPVERFDPRVDQVWEEAGKYYPILAKRDFCSLRWRFDEAVESACYRRYYLWKRGRVCGYFVLRQGTRDGVNVVNLVDFLCAPCMVSPLIARAVGVARALGGAALYCRVSIPRAGRYFRPLGFCRRSSFTRVMAIPNKTSGPAPELLSNPSSWFVTMADSDGDYFEDQEVHSRPVTEQGRDEMLAATTKTEKLSAL